MRAVAASQAGAPVWAVRLGWVCVAFALLGLALWPLALAALALAVVLWWPLRRTGRLATGLLATAFCGYAWLASVATVLLYP